MIVVVIVVRAAALVATTLCARLLDFAPLLLCLVAVLSVFSDLFFEFVLLFAHVLLTFVPVVTRLRGDNTAGCQKRAHDTDRESLLQHGPWCNLAY